jgi:hypothetical protein
VSEKGRRYYIHEHNHRSPGVRRASVRRDDFVDEMWINDRVIEVIATGREWDRDLKQTRPRVVRCEGRVELEER